MITLRSKRLVLRDFLDSDLAAYSALRDDSKFQRFYSESEAGPARSAELLALFMQQAAELPRSKFQLAIVSSQGDLMGSCGVRVESAGQASIGCELARHWQGSGVAREATQAIIDFGFMHLKLDRLYAETIAENRAAIALCRSVGMRVESERLADRFFKGRSWNTVVLGLLAQDWHARRPLTPAKAEASQ